MHKAVKAVNFKLLLLWLLVFALFDVSKINGECREEIGMYSKVQVLSSFQGASAVQPLLVSILLL